MSKYGNKYLRTALWQGAVSCINHNKVFTAYFVKKNKYEGKNKMISISHTARKLTYILHHLLTTGEEFDAEKAYNAMTLPKQV